MDYKIQTIDYYSKDDLDIYQEIYNLTKATSDTYSRYKKWLFEKFFPDLKNGNRKMVLARDENKQLAGIALLKDTEEEKKLCCLFIREDCRGYGIANSLVQKSIQLLNTDKPFLTVSDKKLPQLKKLIEINNFKFSYRKKGVYKEDAIEYYFNNEATEILKEKVLVPLFARAARNSR